MLYIEFMQCINVGIQFIFDDHDLMSFNYHQRPKDYTIMTLSTITCFFNQDLSSSYITHHCVNMVHQRVIKGRKHREVKPL